MLRGPSPPSSPRPSGPSRRRRQGPAQPAVARIGRCDTGVVFEQRVQLLLDQGSAPIELRRIELHLDKPTEDGDTVLRLLTNLPEETFSASRVANLYRRR
jgi:hypothetical protein